ncbi:hypothetical protein KO519_00065, partial [Paraglaciecola agarilytica]|uniref:hypothetical protein n=1 Tax=Paraglaciecola chathamensis TaxID=368405 RepID=UPI001C0A15FF
SYKRKVMESGSNINPTIKGGVTKLGGEIYSFKILLVAKYSTIRAKLTKNKCEIMYLASAKSCQSAVKRREHQER